MRRGYVFLMRSVKRLYFLLISSFRFRGHKLTHHTQYLTLPSLRGSPVAGDVLSGVDCSPYSRNVKIPVARSSKANVL